MGFETANFIVLGFETANLTFHVGYKAAIFDTPILKKMKETFILFNCLVLCITASNSTTTFSFDNSTSRSDNSTSRSDNSTFYRPNESDIRKAVSKIMQIIELKLQNSSDSSALSKRQYGSSSYYPVGPTAPFMRQYSGKAYGIIKTGCSGVNPNFYRYAPGGGYYPPRLSGFYKRQESIVYNVDANSENAKIMQKQLSAAFEDLTLRSTLSRRTPAPSVSAPSFFQKVRSFLGYADQIPKNSVEPAVKPKTSAAKSETDVEHPVASQPKNSRETLKKVVLYLAGATAIFYLLRWLLAPKHDYDSREEGDDLINYG